MPNKRAKKPVARGRGSGDSGVVLVDSLQEQKNEKIRLFMLDFQQQAKDRMLEVKKELEALAALPGQIVEMELLKMPPSIRQMKFGDYKKMMEVNKDAAPLKGDSRQEDTPEGKLERKGSKKVKISADHMTSNTISVAQRTRAVQKVTKSQSLVTLTADSAKKPTLHRSISATPLKMPRKGCAPASSSRVASQTRYVSTSSTRSSRKRGASPLGDHQPLLEGVPLVHIPLVDGQTVSSAVDDLDSVNVELLRQDTVQHIHTLVGQLTNLCAKASSQMTSH